MTGGPLRSSDGETVGVLTRVIPVEEIGGMPDLSWRRRDQLSTVRAGRAESASPQTSLPAASNRSGVGAAPLV